MKIKNILLILFTILSNIIYSQVLSTYSIVEMDNMDSSPLESPRSPWRYSRVDSTLYRFNYNTLTWDTFSSGGGGIGSSLVRNDSVFIVSGTDTVYSGVNASTWLKPELEGGNNVSIIGSNSEILEIQDLSLVDIGNYSNNGYLGLYLDEPNRSVYVGTSNETDRPTTSNIDFNDNENEAKIQAITEIGGSPNLRAAIKLVASEENVYSTTLANSDTAKTLVTVETNLFKIENPDSSRSVFEAQTTTGDIYIMRYPGTKEDTARYILGVQSDGKVVPIKSGISKVGTILAEISTSAAISQLNGLLPVNCTSGAIEVDLPAGTPSPGDFFIVTDSRANANTFNITIDFISAGDNLHGSSQNYIINTDGATVEFTYINSTIGWIVK